MAILTLNMPEYNRSDRLALDRMSMMLHQIRKNVGAHRVGFADHGKVNFEVCAAAERLYEDYGLNSLGEAALYYTQDWQDSLDIRLSWRDFEYNGWV
jgi:hypothetical protein